jgi:hypothetical protein
VKLLDSEEPLPPPSPPPLPLVSCDGGAAAAALRAAVAGAAGRKALARCRPMTWFRSENDGCLMFSRFVHVPFTTWFSSSSLMGE